MSLWPFKILWEVCSVSVRFLILYYICNNYIFKYSGVIFSFYVHKTIGSSNDNQGQGSLEPEPYFCKKLPDCNDCPECLENCPITCKDVKNPKDELCEFIDCTIPGAFEECKETCTKKANGN